LYPAYVAGTIIGLSKRGIYMDLFAKILFTALEFSAILLLSLSLFRVYFTYSLHKVAIIALVMASISIYIRDVLGFQGFTLLPVLVSEISLITILFRLPLIFSFLVCVIGILATATFETLVIFLGSYFNVFSEHMLATSLPQFISFEIINTVILLLVMYPIQKYKLGFHTTSNDAIKAYNFWLSAILITAIFTIQTVLVLYKESTIHILIPIVLGIMLLTGVYLAYQHNKNLWKNRRERLSKR
jgi:hypothetical protein